MIRARARALAGALALLLLAGCNTLGGDPQGIRRKLGPQTVVLDVPVVRQKADKGCGLACLVSLLRYYGKEVDDEARARFSEDRLEREAIAAGEIRDYLRERNWRATLVKGSLGRGYPTGLLSIVDRGLPVIVEVATTKLQHFGLVCGYDPKRELVLVMDPSMGIVGIPYANFEEHWARADHLMLVAEPRDANPLPPGPAAEPGPTLPPRHEGRRVS